MHVLWRGIKSSIENGADVIGHFPVSLTYFSINFFSKRNPLILETTGSDGTSPETKLLIYFKNQRFNALNYVCDLLEQNIYPNFIF